MSADVFSDVKNKLGFGCMRFPLRADKSVDTEQVCSMVDLFISEGFNYFDTAHGYLDGQSETVLRTCLTSRYPRSAYLLADKLSNAFFEKEEDILPLFRSQLEACGAEYFDYYLMHALNKSYYEKYRACNAFGIVRDLRAQGLVRHMGMSFHDSADVLDMILSEEKDIEFVQLQVNYLDWESEKVQSRLCCDVCRKHGVRVIIMEPVKGGTLSQLLPEAASVLDRLPDRQSNASYALRFAAGIDVVSVVLSGMSTLSQVEENTRLFKSVKPLNEEEMQAIKEVAEITQRHGSIACTACNYCTEVCPVKMPVSSIFALMNRNEGTYAGVTKETKASDCLNCGRCEAACPQGLPIRRYLGQAVFRYETE